jgi:hypothetical protein
MTPSRAVPTLTEVLDEAVWRAEPVADATVDVPFVPIPEWGAPALPSADFDLDLGEMSSAQALPDSDSLQAQGSDAHLRQRLSQAVEVAVDELLQQAAARLAESLLVELRQQLAPQLDLLFQQALDEALRHERGRLPG